MYKTNQVVLLSEKDIEHFNRVMSKKGVLKKDLISEALSNFKKKLLKSKPYELKHQEIDRIKDLAFIITLFEDTLEEVKELCEKFKIGRNRMLREVICEYLDRY